MFHVKTYSMLLINYLNIYPCVSGLDMCETTIQDMKWMRRANWQNNPSARLARSTSVDLPEQLEEKVCQLSRDTRTMLY